MLLETETWQHFPSGTVGQDARGCRTACADELHDRFGRTQISDAGPYAA